MESEKLQEDVIRSEARKRRIRGDPRRWDYSDHFCEPHRVRMFRGSRAGGTL